MRSRREFSPHALSVLAALCEQPSVWQHGYALARRGADGLAAAGLAGRRSAADSQGPPILAGAG